MNNEELEKFLKTGGFTYGYKKIHDKNYLAIDKIFYDYIYIQR